MLEVILVQRFCPLKIKITQFPNGFRPKRNSKYYFKVKKLWNSLLLSISFSFEYKKIQESFKNF